MGFPMFKTTHSLSKAPFKNQNNDFFICKGPFIRIKHYILVKYYQTLLDPTYVTRLNSTIKYVGRCWMKFDFFQTFHPTSTNIFARMFISWVLVLKPNIVGWSWIHMNGLQNPTQSNFYHTPSNTTQQ